MYQSFNPEIVRLFRDYLSAKPLKIVVTTHHKPDGDALGSSLGWATVLSRLGHEVSVVTPSEYPDFLAWMSGSDKVVDFIKSPHRAESLLTEAQLICCLDFNDPSRVEAMTPLLQKANGKKMLLDHHLDPKAFCDFTFSNPRVGSTAELVIHLIHQLGYAELLDMPAAECLYAGIMTDTGSFRFNTVTPLTHESVAFLLRLGVRSDYIHEMVYDTFTEDRTRFLGHCLINCMNVLPEFNTVFFAVPSADMSRFNHQSGDLEGIVNYGLHIKGIKMAALFSERDGMVKISFRSKGDFSVKALSEKYFEGGGHKNAAGGRSRLSLADTVEKFRQLLPEYKAQLLA